MDRRTLLVGFLALAAPVAAEAQPSAKVFRIGLLGGSSPTSPEASHLWGAFFQRLHRVAVLVNPTIPSSALAVREVGVAARALKLRLQVLEARAPTQFAEAFSAATSERAGALLIITGSMFFAHRARLVELAAQSRLPAVYSVREFAEAGGLIAYGADIGDSFRRAADDVDWILKGAKPSDLPVEQPTKLELVVNLRTARALGLTIPPSVLARADQVID